MGNLHLEVLSDLLKLHAKVNDLVQVSGTVEINVFKHNLDEALASLKAHISKDGAVADASD